MVINFNFSKQDQEEWKNSETQQMNGVVNQGRKPGKVWIP